MQTKLLKDIVSYIVGPNSVGIVNLLYGKKNVNEFLIAKKLKITINQARNLLYRLADEGLVSFIRKKDKKNGGWYTYFWTLDVERSLYVLKQKLANEIDNLNKQVVSKQMKQFYYCPNCGLELTEENALLYDFTCPECGEIFELKDNTEHVIHIQGKIAEFQKKLVLVDKEIELIEKKSQATKLRKEKSEERKRKAERETKRKQREMEKKREAKKKEMLEKKKKEKRLAKKRFFERKIKKKTRKRMAIKKRAKELKARKVSKTKKRRK